MKHKRFEENILVDEAYANYGATDKNADQKKGHGIAKHFADSLQYEEKKKWYHQLPEEPVSVDKTPTDEQIEALRREASSALLGDTTAYETKLSKNSSSDHQWARTLLNKGTPGDRVAAATILIQDNPLYNLTALRNLVNGVKPAKKKDAITIIDALSELLMAELLIPDVKLRTFAQHPLGHLDEITSGNKQARRNILKLWYFEDQLKELYGTYVEALNKLGHDTVDASKEKAVSAMSYLLMHHPEREKVLLSNIINKLGDPSQSVASKVIYHLCQLIYNHPNMKAVVLTEIEKMLFRPNISPRAQYYGICYLNQFYLEKDDSKIAETLIKIYFAFFKASIKKGEINSRLMAGILTGVKRAYPFADTNRLNTSEHINAVHKLVHLANINTAIHALALLFQITDGGTGTSDRYYQALYRKLTSGELFTTTHSALLFSLIYKSLKSDKDVNRVAAFVKRLLQLCCYVPPAQACGLLYLISQVLKDKDKKDAVKLVWTKAEVKEEIKEENPKPETAVNKDKPIDLNGTVDFMSDEEKEELKKVKEVTVDAEVTVDTEVTVDKEVKEDPEVKKEEEDAKKYVKIDLLKGDKKDLLLDDEEESYVDLKLDSEGNTKPSRRHTAAVPSSWHHVAANREGGGAREKERLIALKKTLNSDTVISSYNPLARNPSYAGAQCSAYFELRPLASHFHPTVKLFAEKILNDQIVQYSGDPLKDFSGIRFLDRFVFKNPKRRSKPEEEDGKVKIVKGSHPKFAVRKNYSAKGIKSIPVNSATYLNEDATRIPVDEKFLYDFLQKRRSAQESDDDDDSDKDSVTSEDFDKYLDSVTGTKGEDSEEELDYLAEMEASKSRQPKKKADDAIDEALDSGDDDDDDEMGDDGAVGDEEADDSDGELNISADEDEPMLSADEEELRLEDSDDDDSLDMPGKKAGKGKMKLKLKGKDDLSSLFASAEEFSTLLEETASNKKQGTSQAVSTTDNASMKQLAWEEKRDRWIKGYNRKVMGNRGKGRKNFKPGNPDMSKGAKRKGGQNNFGGKKKKVK